MLLLAAILSLAAFLPSPSRSDGATTVILVRHAEKAAAPGNDPVLDSTGERRARDLAATLRNAKVGAILVTQYQRTQLTAAPLARATGITPRIVDTRAGGEAHAKSVADAARGEVGKTVLVVGHSNTIPSIVSALGATAEPIADDDYDDLYVVMISSSGAARAIHARYGAPARSTKAAATQ
ncbi:MAG TPA: phosphoglycerate mutase family protein [Gemmatimonadaceae bacterium]|nr:phosphoglycerate mutase family protein [Gemmatimonadaceae bacterium]